VSFEPLRIAVPPRVHAPFVVVAFPPRGGVVVLVAELLTPLLVVVVAFPPRGGVVLLVAGLPTPSVGLTFIVIGVST